LRVMRSEDWLYLAQNYAEKASGCLKVRVGCIIVKNNRAVSLGANRTIPDLCTTARGCLRVEKYGENTKVHRNPEDCRAIHAEIDAICTNHSDLVGATLYVTRYPCEACARVIIDAGIYRVVYGREQKISSETAQLFDRYNIDVIHYSKFSPPDVSY
jgi:dCMP deaminase